MKYLLLSALVVAGSVQAGNKEDCQKRNDRRAANMLVGTAGMALVNQDLVAQRLSQKGLFKKETSKEIHPNKLVPKKDQNKDSNPWELTKLN